MNLTYSTGLLLLLHLSARGADPLTFLRHRLTIPPGSEIRGAALSPGRGLRLLVWGTELWEAALPEGALRQLAAGVRAWGGCPAATPGVFLEERSGPGALTFRRPPDWKPRVIDAGIELSDCRPATLFGRAGLLVIQGGMQVRFYEPGREGYRVIYSFYTPSRQSGILRADVDRDGRADILCGNYWIQQPQKYELPWRLFAINTYSEYEDSATCRLALADLDGDGFEDLVAAQAERSPARLAWFKRPADPRELWDEHRLDAGLGLVRLRGLAVADLDGDARPDIAVGEDYGPGSRLLLFTNRGGGRFAIRELARGEPAIALLAADVNRDGRTDLVSAGRYSIDWWENQRRK